MVTDANLEAHLGALFFLAAAGATLALAIAAAVLTLARNWRLLRIVGITWAAGAALYLVLLLAFSLASREIVLPIGAEKHFCELDCHVAVSVARVDRGIVTIKTHFDETTIGPHRGNAPFTPDYHTVVAIGAHASRIAVELPPASAAEQPTGTPLRPGESYLTRYQFPADLDPQKIFVGMDQHPFPQMIIIGNEASALHRKAYFATR